MDHSVRSYLGRQTTETLLALLQAYESSESEVDMDIAKMVRDILSKRCCESTTRHKEPPL